MDKIEKVIQMLWIKVGEQNVLSISLVKYENQSPKWMLFPEPKEGDFCIRLKEAKETFLHLVDEGKIHYTGGASDIKKIRNDTFAEELEKIAAIKTHENGKAVKLHLEYTSTFPMHDVCKITTALTSELLPFIFCWGDKTYCNAYLEEDCKLKKDNSVVFVRNYYRFALMKDGKYLNCPQEYKCRTIKPDKTTPIQWETKPSKSCELSNIMEAEKILYNYFWFQEQPLWNDKMPDYKNLLKKAYQEGIRIELVSECYAAPRVHPRQLALLETELFCYRDAHRSSPVVCAGNNYKNRYDTYINEQKKTECFLLFTKDMLLEKANGNVSKAFCGNNQSDPVVKALLAAHRWSQGVDCAEDFVAKSAAITKEQIKEFESRLALA